VRVHDVEQRLRDFREIIIEAKVHASGQQRHRLDHALDMRIFAAARLQLQARGDLRIFLGELGAHLAEERQLALVVGEQLIAHEFRPLLRIRR
jgi:hypothetical protein